MKSMSRWIVFAETSSSAAIFWQFGKRRALSAAWSRIIRSSGGRENPPLSFCSSGPVGRLKEASIAMASGFHASHRDAATKEAEENNSEIFYHGTVDVLPPVLG